MVSKSLAAGDFDGDNRDDLAINDPLDYLAEVRVIYGNDLGLSTARSQAWAENSPNIIAAGPFEHTFVPQFVAHETRRFGRECGLVVRNTPAYSPESNGMAEAFVKTFKRDFVYLADVSDAATVMRQLSGCSRWHTERHRPGDSALKLPPRCLPEAASFKESVDIVNRPTRCGREALNQRSVAPC